LFMNEKNFCLKGGVGASVDAKITFAS
jgi:hypothetical protein